MALPASYTENTYKEYLHAALNRGGLAGDLGWTIAGGQYDEILNDALGYYGAEDVTAVSGASNLRKLRIAGRVALWEAVAGATAHYSDASTPDGARANLSQIHAAAIAQLDRAKSDAAAAGLDGLSLYPPVVIGSVRYKDDPYHYYETDDEAS